MKHRSRLLFLCSVLFFFGNSLKAQKFHPDTSYYETYYNDVTARVFVTQKYVDFKLPSNGGKDLEYHGNKKFNTGVGATWHNLTVNVFYGFSFLNRDTAKGKTKGLDLQFHF